MKKAGGYRVEQFDFVDIKEVIKVDSEVLNRTKILAHISDNKENETLEEHTMCCEKYFERLMKERQLENILENFLQFFFKESETTLKNIFRKLFSNVITFHDFGKINPAYQKNRLKNKKFPQCGMECLDGDRHSMLSSTIYFDYFKSELKKEELEKTDREKLNYFVYLNSYVISRHHGDLAKQEENPFGVYKQNFVLGGSVPETLQKMENNREEILYNGPFFCKDKYGNGIDTSRKSFYESYKGTDFDKVLTYVYAYVKFIYSILISCDYYATTEYKTGVEIRDYGKLDEIDEINQIYEQTERIIGIRKGDNSFDDGEDINILRNRMFRECEENLMKNLDKRIFFLEAPTGSGKSNMSVNVSLKLLNETTRKIIYVYPFNTLVEQNIRSLNEIFGDSGIRDKIAVINSIYPMKRDEKEVAQLKDKEDEEKFYQKTLLDRQFLNYPFILTTHVHLFDIMFGCSKESAISFYQLANSVIVLDEIQSYKNDIWTEIMYFFQCFAEILNIKVVIMSATLPKMDYLTGMHDDVVSLIQNRNCYFEDKRFLKRVELSFELLERDIDFEILAEHLKQNVGKDRNVFVEFIKKKSAYDFFDYMKELELEDIDIYCLTGDYNQADREKTLEAIHRSKGNLLIATQVVEAGVDIDMDIGYKDISKLDSEEQFLGRINRNYKSKFGKAYFFNMDNASGIYKGDFRIEQDFSIIQKEMQDVLKNKQFEMYYQKILDRIKESLNSRQDEIGIEEFKNSIKELRLYTIQKRMELINRDEWSISIFIPRVVTMEDGSIIDGMKVWNEYKELLNDNKMEYAKKQVKLSDVKSLFGFFVYKVSRKVNLQYNDKIGELYLVEDGEQYMENGHLNIEEFSLFC